MHKALLWAANNFVREWARKLHDPQEAAHRRGVLDYLFRRFGDCPPEVRALAVDMGKRANNERGAEQAAQCKERKRVVCFQNP